MIAEYARLPGGAGHGGAGRRVGCTARSPYPFGVVWAFACSLPPNLLCRIPRNGIGERESGWRHFQLSWGGVGGGCHGDYLLDVLVQHETRGGGAAQAIIAEIGLDMAAFGTPGRLVSWAKRCPQTRQSGTKTSTGKAGKGNPYLGGVLGEIAASAGRTDTFLGERYRRLARRRGKRKALVAVARSILVIIFHLLADPEARFHDLGPGYYDTHIDRQRKIRNHIRQLEALGLDVTTAPRHDAA